MSRRSERFINSYDLSRILNVTDVPDPIRARHYCDNPPAARQVILIPEDQAINILRYVVDDDIHVLKMLAKLKVWSLNEIIEEGWWIMYLE